ncbi:MAG: hypothetical protein ABR501_15155 [Pyrinomonadaceae bacterium]
MFEPSYGPPPALYESQWWVRLAAFAPEARNGQGFQGKTSPMTLPAHQVKATKSGFPMNLRRPLLLSAYTSDDSAELIA